MKYCLNIDWLSVFGLLMFDPYYDPEQPTAVSKEDFGRRARLPQIDPWTYEVAPYGTRQFRSLVFVYFFGEKIAEVQSVPASDILVANSCLIKFDNRLLYTARFRDLVTRFLADHQIKVQRVSRVDLCADFLSLNGYDCHQFIKDFLSMELRHIGRGLGAAYFHHKAAKVPGTSYTMANMRYSGLSFGTHGADVRVYLYNKTKELAEVKDKPHIRDMWCLSGMVDFADYAVDRQVQMKDGMRTFFHNTKDCEVWRLEVSIKGDGIRFTNKDTKEKEEITLDRLFDHSQVELIYGTFIHYYFQFVKNRPGISNITREPRINLLGKEHPYMLRIIPRKVSGGNMAERIAIHKLWQLHQELRGMSDEHSRHLAQGLAVQIAKATDLKGWLSDKFPTWEQKHFKQ